jgi:hypothetical protein
VADGLAQKPQTSPLITLMRLIYTDQKSSVMSQFAKMFHTCPAERRASPGDPQIAPLLRGLGQEGGIVRASLTTTGGKL